MSLRSGILHYINTGYTKDFNVKTGRVRHFFQGLYGAIPVEKDTYALELSRYIHLNPAKTHLLKKPSDYAWSSYLGYLGKEKRREWLKRDFILGLVSGDEREARDRYGRYIGGRDGVVSEGSLWGNGRFYVFGF